VVASGLEDPLTLDEYLELPDATGRSLATGKRGQIDPRLAPILARLDLRVEDWIATHGRLAHAENKGEQRKWRTKRENKVEEKTKDTRISLLARAISWWRRSRRWG
jgi:hypothetical protein